MKLPPFEYASPATLAEAALNGRVVDESSVREAASAAAAAVNPPEDLHASAAYRRSLVGTLLERALARASKITD